MGRNTREVSLLQSQDISYDEIQQVLDEVLESESFSFGDFVEALLSGRENGGVVDMFWRVVKNSLNVLTGQENVVSHLLVLAVLGAVFTNFSKMLQKKQIADTSFYVTYLLFFTTLASSYKMIMTQVTVDLTRISDFMKALIPAYYLSLAFATDAASSAAFYQLTLAAVGVMEVFLLCVALPAVNIYFVIRMVSQLMREPGLDRLSQLIERIIHWGLKTILLVVVGLQVIQGLVLPEVSMAKKNLFIRAGGALPGVGNTFTTTAETVVSAASLLKDAIGAAGLLGLSFVCVLPVLRLALFSLAYYGIAAVIQPVSDKRIMAGVEGMADTLKLLLHMVCVSGILFFLSIAIVSTLSKG